MDNLIYGKLDPVSPWQKLPFYFHAIADPEMDQQRQALISFVSEIRKAEAEFDDSLKIIHSDEDASKSKLWVLGLKKEHQDTIVIRYPFSDIAIDLKNRLIFLRDEALARYCLVLFSVPEEKIASQDNIPSVYEVIKCFDPNLNKWTVGCQFKIISDKYPHLCIISKGPVPNRMIANISCLIRD